MEAARLTVSSKLCQVDNEMMFSRGGGFCRRSMSVCRVAGEHGVRPSQVSHWAMCTRLGTTFWSYADSELPVYPGDRVKSFSPCNFRIRLLLVFPVGSTHAAPRDMELRTGWELGEKCRI